MMKKTQGTYKGIKWECAKILSIFKWVCAIPGEHFTARCTSIPQPEVPGIDGDIWHKGPDHPHPKSFSSSTWVFPEDLATGCLAALVEEGMQFPQKTCLRDSSNWPTPTPLSLSVSELIRQAFITLVADLAFHSVLPVQILKEISS